MRTSRKCCLILLVVFAGGLILSRASGAESQLFPRPSHDAIVKALAKVRDVYKADLAKANKPKEKATLAEELLTAADGVGQDDAGRLALLTLARDLAVDANDGRLAVKVVRAIVSRFVPDGPTDPAEQIRLGSESWTKAETALSDERLHLQVQAAEWYVRAQPVVTGLDETLIAKRLAEIGEPGPPDNKQPSPASSNQSLPTGRVRIVSRSTGHVLRDDLTPLRIERAGDYYKIRCQESGTNLLGLAGWASKEEFASKPPTGRHRGFEHQVSDSESPSALWTFRPLGNGFWTITNRATGKCLEMRKEKPLIWQSPFHDGDLQQQWRIEPFEGVGNASTEPKVSEPSKPTPAAEPSVEPAQSPGESLDALRASHTQWVVWWKGTANYTHPITGMAVVPPSWGHYGDHPWGGVVETHGTYSSAAPKVFSETIKGTLKSYKGNEVALEHVQRWGKGTAGSRTWRESGEWRWIDVDDATFRASNLSDFDQRFLSRWRRAEQSAAPQPKTRIEAK